MRLPNLPVCSALLSSQRMFENWKLSSSLIEDAMLRLILLYKSQYYLKTGEIVA